MVSQISFRRLFFISGVAMLGFIMIMRFLTEPLTTGDVVGFELAKTVDAASRIMTEWSIDPAGRMGKANLAIQLDFIFIILYTLFFFLGVRFMGGLAGHPVLHKAGRGFSWMVILAGLCDVAENISMLRTLSHEPLAWIVHLTYDMAVMKFSLLMIAAFFMIISFVIWLMKRPDSE